MRLIIKIESYRVRKGNRISHRTITQIDLFRGYIALLEKSKIISNTNR